MTSPFDIDLELIDRPAVGGYPADRVYRAYDRRDPRGTIAISPASAGEGAAYQAARRALAQNRAIARAAARIAVDRRLPSSAAVLFRDRPV